MKIIKNLTFTALAALAVTLLFQTPTTQAGDLGKAALPSNPFVILLEGTFELANVADVPDLGLVRPQLKNGKYQTVPIYDIASGVPGPTDQAVGTFYALGGEMLFAYDLRKGALTAMMIDGTSVVERIPDAVGNGFTLAGTYELDILEATGIYRSFAGGHIHMVDVLHVTPGTPIVRVSHCFCYVLAPTSVNRLMLTVSRSASGVNISFDSETGASYQLQSAIDLSSTTTGWSDEGAALSGSGSRLSFAPAQKGERKFFRVLRK